MSYQRGKRQGIGAIDADSDPMWSGADDPMFTRTRRERSIASNIIERPGHGYSSIGNIFDTINKLVGGASNPVANCAPALKAKAQAAAAKWAAEKNKYEALQYIYVHSGKGRDGTIRQSKVVAAAKAAYLAALAACKAPPPRPRPSPGRPAGVKGRPSKPAFGQFGSPVKGTPGVTPPGPATQSDPGDASPGSPSFSAPSSPGGSGGGSSGGGSATTGAPSASPSSFSPEQIDELDPAPDMPPQIAPPPAPIIAPPAGADAKSKPINPLILIAAGLAGLYLLTRTK